MSSWRQKGQFNALNKLKIARALMLATGGKALATRVNTRRNIAAVDLDCPEAAEKMLMVSVLQNIAVKTYLSRPPAQSRGIVRPRFEAEKAEVVEGISSETPIQRAEVFARGHTVKLHFNGPRPPHVDLWGLRLPVSAAYPRPLQCGACGRLGHTRRACRDQNRCPYCCGRHPGNTCRSNTARCPNCGGGHDAFDRGCGAYAWARAAARDAEDQRGLATPHDSQGERPPPWSAGHRATQGSPPLNPDSFPELGTQEAGAGTSAHSRGEADINGERADGRPTAGPSGRAPRTRGGAPPLQNAGQSEAMQAPTTESSSSPTSAPARQGRRPAWQRGPQQPTPSPADPARLGEAQQTPSPVETARREQLAPSFPSLGEAARVTSTIAPGKRGFPRALRGNKPGGFPQGPSAQRGGQSARFLERPAPLRGPPIGWPAGRRLRPSGTTGTADQAGRCPRKAPASTVSQRSPQGLLHDPRRGSPHQSSMATGTNGPCSTEVGPTARNGDVIRHWQVDDPAEHPDAIRCFSARLARDPVFDAATLAAAGLQGVAALAPATMPPRPPTPPTKDQAGPSRLQDLIDVDIDLDLL
ncbi:hypothetical protein HPB47_016327 [Ixodes persulcatus]|uniref:Uncharacterized protein n=1 Tax=Ixodes persulcatus TaxID=34615 RepID=A0AC60QUU7_IXOPE|nr:hypothetical protein HPB47_016327 [Ixodes persulcatus]